MTRLPEPTSHESRCVVLMLCTDSPCFSSQSTIKKVDAARASLKDRSLEIEFKQASEALTKVQSKLAAEVKDEKGDPSHMHATMTSANNKASTVQLSVHC